MATSRKKRLTAAELRRGIANFDKKLRERRDDAARNYHGKVAQLLPETKARYRHQWATYSTMLHTLACFTDDEFGETAWDGWDGEPPLSTPEPAAGGDA